MPKWRSSRKRTRAADVEGLLAAHSLEDDMRTAPLAARLRASGDVRLDSVAAANTEYDAMKPLEPLDWNMKVWRYTDLPKLINLLETGSLHFCRADTLGDPYEGSWARPDVAAREKQFQSIAAELGTSRSPMLEKIRDHFEEKASIDLADPSVSNAMAGGLRRGMGAALVSSLGYALDVQWPV